MNSFSRSVLPFAAALALAGLPSAVLAQGTEEQQQACTPDAVKLCSDTIPDIPKTTACMKAHYAQLSPRCQSAFKDATGGASTRSAARPAEPRSRVAARHPDRAERAAPAPEETRSRREAALPPAAPDNREFDDYATLPRTPGYPPFPSPDAPIVHAQVPGVDGARSQIARACRDGLIDSFTCSTTIPALGGGGE